MIEAVAVAVADETSAGRGAAGGERHGQAPGLRRDFGGPGGPRRHGSGDQHRQARGRRRNPHPPAPARRRARDRAHRPRQGAGHHEPRRESSGWRIEVRKRGHRSGGHRADGRRARDLLPARTGNGRARAYLAKTIAARLNGLAWKWRGSAWPSPARATCGDGWAMTKRRVGRRHRTGRRPRPWPGGGRGGERGHPDFPEAHQRGAGRDTRSRPRCPAQHSRGGRGHRRYRL